MYITLNRFYDDIIVERLFNDNLIISEQDILYNLELYKYITTEEIVNKINLTDNNSDYMIMEEPLEIAEIKPILDKYDVYAYSLYGRELGIAYDKYMPLNKNSLEMDLNNYKISYKYLTPYNHKSLASSYEEVSEYKPMLLFTRILLEAINSYVTDVHLTIKHFSREPTYCVDFRVKDDLLPFEKFKLNKKIHSEIIREVINKKSKSNVSDLSTFSGVETLVEDFFNDGSCDLRVGAVTCLGGYTMTSRIQGKSTTSLKINELGFDETVVEDLYTIERKHNGLALITGSIRTGKNTTAFAIANELVTKPLKLLDISSPIETLMPFTQIDYMSVSDNLYNVVSLVKKLDTDVVFINEIPNKQVAKGVLDLVNSSVGVITTFHFDRIWHFPYKLKEYYGESMYDMIPQINGVFTQKMFVKQCPHCREESHFEGLDTVIIDFLHSHNITKIVTPKGCSVCNNTGLAKGVQPYAESMIFTQKIKSDLLACKSTNEMETYIRNYVLNNKRSLEFKLADAVAKGDLSYKSIYKIL